MLPIYGKPMIYYPLTTLIKCGINEILIISGLDDSDKYKELLGDGAEWGCKFSYAVQKEPNGIAQAFVIGENFIGNDNVCLILGDNIFHGINYSSIKKTINNDFSGGLIFGYEVSDPERYGVVSQRIQKLILLFRDYIFMITKL